MATWAKGIDFKNSGNTTRIGSVGIYGTDTSAEKIYIGLGTEPWNNAGLQITSSNINFKGNKMYHAGDKPTPADIGAAASSHNHTSLSSVTSIGGAGASSSWGSLDITGAKGSWQGIHFKDYGYVWMVRNDGYTGMWKNAGNAVFAFDQNGSLATGTVPWSKLTGVPSSFTPASHTHSYLTGINDTRSTEYTPATARKDFKVTFQSNGTNGVNDGGTYYSLMHIPRWADSAGGYGSQLIFTDNENIWYRRGTSDSAWGSWRRIWHSGNFDPNSKANSSHTHNYAGSSSAGGAANTAVKLGTARKLTIGNTGKTFDGSADVSWSLSEIGAAASSHNHGLLHDNLTTTLANTTTDSGWSMINSSYNGFLLKSIRTQASTPNWIVNNYGAGIAFGGSDTKGVISAAYNTPLIKFAGGNSTAPVWWIGLTGTSGATYNLASFSTTSHNHDGVYMKQANANGYYGMTANGDASNWVRTTNNGIIPYASGGASSLGTSSWPFSNIYANNIYDNGTLLENKFAAASHSHAYLPLTGGTMTGAISSSLTTSTHLAGNKGTAIINSTAAGSGYNMLAKMNSTNGVWTFGSYGANFNFYYTANSTITAGTNNVTKALTLLNESGNSAFPGTVSAPTFSGALSGNASTATTLQTARTINGTSFNGSANITTANWGTARTLTIGNTGKSVNGSENVSWSLTEIGGNTGITANTLALRDGSGDITARLMKSTYANQTTISGALAFRVNNSSDNYIRFCSDAAAVRTWLGAAASSHTHSYLPVSGGVTSGMFTTKNTNATAADTGYLEFMRSNGNRGARFTSSTDGLGLRLHMYYNDGTWATHYIFGERGELSAPKLKIRGSSMDIGSEGDNSAWIGFHDTTGRKGWVGKGYTTTNTIYLYAESGDILLNASTNYAYSNAHFLPDLDNTFYLGITSPISRRWKQLIACTTAISTSDSRNKINITPIVDDVATYKDVRTVKTFDVDMPKEENATKQDYYDFMKDRFNPYAYSYKITSQEEDGSVTQDDKEKLAKSIGFVADEYDLENDKVAKEFIFRTEDGILNYNTGNYATVIAIALQKAIEKIELLENENKELKNTLSTIQEKLGL